MNVPAIVKFQVVDPGLGDTAKGLHTGHVKGGVRPLLDWTTEYADADGGLAEVGARRYESA